jgi:CubicO group peptidase (beta-lactamase class C family)
MIIHKVAGKPYGEFLRERIFDPLGMKDTRGGANVAGTDLRER